MGVQALGPELAVEALDEGVIRRLAGSREVQRDAAVIGPKVKVTGDELRALIDADRFGIANLLANALRGPYHVFPAIAEPGI